VPFLDHKLVEFARQIPRRFQVKSVAGKYILKHAVRGSLPDSIVFRKKLGFPTPSASRLNGIRLQIIQDHLSEPRSLERKLFSPPALDRLFAEHRSNYRNHSDRLWRLLNLELWHRVCLEGELSLSHRSSPV
jgi:asparagine synthase (glutamine-hydrolysing)